MSNDLKFLLRRINVRIRAEDPTVIEDAVKLTEQYPEESDAWAVLAFAYTIMEDNYPAAIETMTRVIALAPREPAAFDRRGSYLLRAGDYERAIADFSHGLVLCDEWKSDYYRESFHFQRAEAFVQLGRKAEALADLAHVKDDYVFLTIEVRTKAELLALCADASSPDNDGRYNGPTDSTSKEDQEAFDKWQLPDSPDEKEAAAAQQLGAAGLAKAGATLLKWARPRFKKVARILYEAIEADDLDVTDTLVCVYLRRLIALVEAGALEGAGNLRRPRFSEVALPNNADEIEQDEQEAPTDP
jgi:tetratricopeptide (TPR) repeat protein